MNEFISEFITDLRTNNKIPKSNQRNFTLEYLCKLNNYSTCLEFGVFQGGSLNLISKYCKKLVGFDSFDGLPDEWNIGHKVVHKGTFKCKIPKINDNTTLEVGLFQSTLVPFLQNNPNISIDMIHFDMDIYSAAYFVFDTLIKFDKLKNVTIVFDELINYPNFKDGEIKALYEMVKLHDLKYEIIGTHGNVLNIKDFHNYNLNTCSFPELRKKGYMQECAIKILDYNLNQM